MNRLTWQRSDYATYGTAGNVRLFTITYRTTRTAPAWQLRTGLPGWSGKQWANDDHDALKAKAEQLLARWLSEVDQPATLPAGTDRTEAQ